MKTINFELSKILNDLGLLDNIETEWKIQLLPTKKGNKWNKGRLVKNWNGKGRIYKTLTLEEVIEFLPKYIKNDKFSLEAMGSGWVVRYSNDNIDLPNLHKTAGFSILEAIEKMIEYLLDNNLLTK